VKKILFVVAATLMFPLAARAQKAVLTPAADLKWVEPPGAPPGVKAAVVSGDPTKGPHHAFTKFAAGFAAPVHHHTADHHVVVVAGTLVLVVDGKDVTLPPGSYFSFTKKMKHATRCEAGAECILFSDVRGKWDVVIAEEKKAPKKDK
jgi:quercetin dioxygenase-like cupin family protein